MKNKVVIKKIRANNWNSKDQMMRIRSHTKLKNNKISKWSVLAAVHSGKINRVCFKNNKSKDKR